MKKFDNYCSNLAVFSTAVHQDLSNDFIISGIKDKFSIQFELGWKVLKSLLVYDGSLVAQTGSPRDIIKEAYRFYDFVDAELWLEMLKCRNEMTHIYDGEAVNKLISVILNTYLKEFENVKAGILERYNGVLDSIP